MDDLDERKWIVGIVSDGAKSDYWKVLKEAIQEWITDEHKRLNYYKSIGIDGESDMSKYNRAVDRIRYLNKFLTINETIVNHHKSLLEKVKEKGEEKFNSLIDFSESFVRRIKK